MTADRVDAPAPEPSVEDGPSAPELHAAEVAALFREHNRTLVNFLLARLKSEHDAREVAQEAYVRLLQLDRPGGVSFLRAYLFRVAANLATDRLRQRTVRTGTESIELFDELSTERNATEVDVVAADELAFIRRCLHELPERWRDAFIRHRIHGESEVSIAHSLGLTDRMVRNYIMQVLFYCRVRLDGATPQEAKERLKK